MNQERLRKLQSLMQASGMHGAALVPGPNMIYFTGIHAHLSERPIVLFLPVDDQPIIIIPALEAMKARQAGISAERILAWSDEEGFDGAFHAAAAALELTSWRLGVETLYLRFLESQLLLAAAPDLNLVAADKLISAIRGVKDADEIAAMEQAVAIAEKAMAGLIPRIRVGMTEKELAAMLTQALLDSGADAVSFSPIVASGPNSAVPHAVATNRMIAEGDLLLFDWGALCDGYASDITRTFAVGAVDQELQDIYNAVMLANEAGKAVIRPGLEAQQVDRAARKKIHDAGFGDYFIHRTGHGLGLEVHEDPSLVEGNATPLQEGNTFTVEPGIYLDGRGGVRIEDDVLVTSDGCRSLTSFPRELQSVGIGS